MYGTSDYTLCGPLAINHRGYLHAAIAGTYIFTTIRPDDRVILGLGSYARTAWTTANAAINLWYNSATTSYSFVVTAGTYIPIRVVAANNGPQTGGAGGMIWSVTVTNLYGVDYNVGSSAEPGSANLVRFSCDNTIAPMYPNSIGEKCSVCVCALFSYNHRQDKLMKTSKLL